MQRMTWLVVILTTAGVIIRPWRLPEAIWAGAAILVVAGVLPWRNALIGGAAAASQRGWAMGIGSAPMALAFILARLIASVLSVIPLTLILGPRRRDRGGHPFASVARAAGATAGAAGESRSSLG